MLESIIKLIRKIFLIDWIQTYRHYRALLKVLANLTEVELDNKIIEKIDKMIERKSVGLSNKQKIQLAKKLNIESYFIPEIEVSWDEKSGFKTGLTFDF